MFLYDRGSIVSHCPIDCVSSFPGHLPYAALGEVWLRLAGPRGGHDEPGGTGHGLGLLVVVGAQVVPHLVRKGHRGLGPASRDLQCRSVIKDT